MSDWQAQNQAVWLEVQFALDHSIRSTIAWITCDSYFHLRTLVAEFKQQFPDNRHFEHRIDKFEENNFPLYFRNHLPAEALDDSIQHAFVHLFGLELHVGIGNSKPDSRLFEALNFEREILFNELPFITVIWSDTYSQIKAQTLAPDFWDWLTKKFHFDAPDIAVEQELAFLQENKSLVAPEKRDELYHQISKHLYLLEHTDRPADRLSLLEVIADNYQALQAYDKSIAYRKQLLELSDLLSPISKARHLNEQGLAFQKVGNYDKALQHYEQSLKIQQEIGNRKGESTTLGNMGSIAHAKGEYETALSYFKRDIKISQKIGDRVGESTSLNNISQIYDARGDYDTALGYLQLSLKISQEIGDKKGESVTLGNMGSIALAKRDYETALSYFENDMKICQEIGDRAGEGVTLNNISSIHKVRGDYDTALGYLVQSLKIREEIGDRAGEGTTLNNIGQIYKTRGDYDTTLSYLEQSLNIWEQIGNISGMATSLHNMGTISYERKDFVRAIPYLLKAYTIFKQIGSPDAKHPEEFLAAIKAKIGEARYQEIVSQIPPDEA